MNNTIIHTDFFSHSAFAPYRASELFQEFRGAFFRSTMKFSKKLEILNQFFARGDVAELPTLIAIFKEYYSLEDTPKRNAEWRAWYGI